MVTHLLFGESIQVLSAKDQWRNIRCLYDDYEGWVDEKQFLPATKDFIDRSEKQYSCSLEVSQSITNHTHHIPIVLGATLPFYDGINLQLPGHSYWFNGQAYAPGDVDDPLGLIEKIALKYNFAPYLWGGRSPFGIDCSGFTQVVFKIIGIRLPRDTYQQVETGNEVSFATSARAGDLAFFPNKKGIIAHVGIILPGNRIIHAHGRVRIDRFDHQGIYNEDKKIYTHKLRVIKRLL